MADPADLGAGGTQEYPNYADDEGEKRYYTLPGPSSIHPTPWIVCLCIRQGPARQHWPGAFEFVA